MRRRTFVGISLLAAAATVAYSTFRHGWLQPENPAPATPPDPPGSIRWRDDLKVLTDTLIYKHKNAFTRITRAQFDAAAADLESRLTTLSDAQALAGLCRLVAMVGDGHTHLWNDGRLTPHVLPLRFVWLKDGIFITSADDQHAALLRTRLTAIGGTPIDNAVNLLAPLVPYENESTRRNRVLDVLHQADLLASVGLTPSPFTAELTVVDDAGGPGTLEVAATNGKVSATAFDSFATSMAPSRRKRDQLYGFGSIDGTSVLYVWYDSCQDQPGQPTVAEFSRQVLDHIDTHNPSRIIIDLRRNSGGTNWLLNPLIRGLARRHIPAQPARLIVLIGRTTFSSAMDNAIDLRRDAGALLLGVPTGGKPSSFGEIKYLTLPSSRLRLQYSTRYFKRDTINAPSVEPDILVEPTVAEYFSPRDVALEAATTYRP